MELKCSTCEETKDCSEFSKKKSSKRGYSYKCKQCHNDYVRLNWYPENKEKQIKSSSTWRENNTLKYKSNKYGVDFEESKLLLELADGKCQICDEKCDLNLDHCHTSSKIRGFLCRSCNLGLGNFKDSIKNLESALQYLKIGVSSSG